MLLRTASYVLMGVALLPFVYYVLVLYSSRRFFRRPSYRPQGADFTPPASILKPVKGLDPEAYENFASYCRQDYPEYEIVFCIDPEDPSLAVIERLKRDFPERTIRVIFHANSDAPNDKVTRLAELVSEARYEYLAINDSDVRVNPDYLRSVIAPLAQPGMGATTCLYVSVEDKTTVDKLQTLGMIADLYPGLLVARELDGIKFALGESIATTRTCLATFGGYAALAHRPADDMLVGRMIAQQGYGVDLLPYPVFTVPDYSSFRSLFMKRLRWMVVMRHMRPWGHFGLVLTQALPWSIIAILLHPSAGVAAAYLGAYVAFRMAIAWSIGIWGLKQSSLWKTMPLLPVWDTMALFIWVGSFMKNNLRWRGGYYHIREGMLVPESRAAED